MLERDCSTVQAYTLALGTMARNDNIEMGRVVYQVAKSSKLYFTAAFYQSSLKLAVRAGDIAWARALFSDMKLTFKEVPGAAYHSNIFLFVCYYIKNKIVITFIFVL